MKATAQIQIDKPIDDVWAFVSIVENMEKWVDGIEEPIQTSEGQTGMGTTFHSKYNYRGKSFEMDHEIHAFDPPNVFGTRSTEGPFAYTGHLTLTESDGGHNSYQPGPG